MSKKLNADLKDAVIDALKIHGTMQYASKVCGVSIRTLNEEMKRSEVFRRRVLDARAEGKINISDEGIQLIRDYAQGLCTFCHGSKKMLVDICPYCKGTGLGDKTDRNRLTAAIALANAYEPGFRGTTTVQGRIDHDVRVITAVPRPNYEALDKTPKKMLKPGKKEIRDGNGNLLAIQTVEEAIEGEIIKEGK